MPATPYEVNELSRPVIAADVAQMSVGRKKVPVHDAVVAAVDAVPALDVVGEAHVGPQVLDARVVEFMRPDDGLPAGRWRPPQPAAGLAQVHVAATDRAGVH